MFVVSCRSYTLFYFLLVSLMRSQCFWEMLSYCGGSESGPCKKEAGVASGTPSGDSETEGGGVKEREEVGFGVPVVSGGGCVGLWLSGWECGGIVSEWYVPESVTEVAGADVCCLLCVCLCMWL